jgi:leucyl aminopeptidase
MLHIEAGYVCENQVFYVEEGAAHPFANGKFKETDWECSEKGRTQYVGIGKRRNDSLSVREVCALAARQIEEKEIKEFSMDIALFLENGIENIQDVIEGAYLGCYHETQYKNEKQAEKPQIYLTGIAEAQIEQAKKILLESMNVMKSVCFARDVVNLPGNKLRPGDFVHQIEAFAGAQGVEVQIMDAGELRRMGMSALLAVGDSSAYPPYLAVLRYMGDPDSSEITGLVGKGVTCDTGGYCLKPAGSMMGIKGDMAGGAAVTGAITALAANHVKVNAVAVIPVCENRIAPGSMLPGDVIDSYGGKTIEIGNTDAEGRLILADAVAYAVKDEKVTRVLDIATLTGAVVGMLGFTIGGAICDDDKFYEKFEQAVGQSKERYLRIPYYEEHEKMIESRIADIKNMGEKHCGTITAGLFIRAFARDTPWLHLDIAGTAWVDSPIYAFQSAGATGAGVTSIYQLCRI